MNDYLTPLAREYLLLPKDDRAAMCCRDVWISHPYGIAATECVKQLVAWPRVRDNPGMALVGSPGVGKSRLAQRWSEDSFAGKKGWAGKILYIDLSNRKNILDLEKRLLQELGMVVRGRAYTMSAKDFAEAQAAVRRMDIRAVIFDEVHGLDRRMSKTRLHNMFEALKGFTNQGWGLNVILCGINELTDLLVQDEQIASRYALRTVTLPDWNNDSIYASFVLSFMYNIPLQYPSDVRSPQFLKGLYELACPSAASRSKGKALKSPLRTIIDILKEACRYAVLSGEEYIDLLSIQKAKARLKGEVDALALLMKHQRAAPGAP